MSASRTRCSTKANNLTSGRIYEQIISRERRGGDYLGKTRCK